MYLNVLVATCPFDSLYTIVLSGKDQLENEKVDSQSLNDSGNWVHNSTAL